MSQILKSKKDYKLEKWFFGKEIEIPEKWEKTTVGNHTSILVGNAFPSKEYSKNPKDVKLLRGDNITEGTTRWKEKTRYWSKHSEFKKYQLFENDFVISMDGSKVGKNYAYITKQDLPCLLVQRVACLRAQPTLIQKYFGYVFGDRNFINYVNSVRTNSGIPHISTKDIQNFPLLLPTLSEQRKIASILSNIDELIISTQKIIDQTKSLKKGLMQKLLTRGIDHKKFKKVKWLFGKEIETPEEWEIKKLDQISDVIDPYPSHRAPKETQTGVPYLGIGDFDENGNILKISRYVDEKIFEEQRKFFKLDPNDIAIGRVASIGKVVKLKYDTRFTISPTLSIIKSKNESNYLIQILKSYRFQRQLHYYTTGSTRSSVGIQIIRKLRVFLPPLQEQQKIATILSNVDSQIISQTQYKEKLERLKKSLMQKLLIGEVRVKI